ncbi:MAG: hypothetical protein R6U32_01670 [Candidatus Woesearchaeota archaeon]
MHDGTHTRLAELADAPGLSGVEEILEEIDRSNQEGIGARMQGRSDHAEDMYRRAVSIALLYRADLKEGGYDARHFMSDFCTNMGDIRRIEGSGESIDEAAKYFTSAIQLAGDDKRRKAKAFEFRGIMHQQYTRDYEQAANDHESALQLYHDIGDQMKTARAHCLYAESLTLHMPFAGFGIGLGNCHKAIRIYDEIIQDRESENKETGNEKSGKEETENEKSDDALRKLHHDLGDAYHTLGRIFSRKGNPDNALDFYRQASFNMHKAGSRAANAVIGVRMAVEYMNTGSSSMAGDHIALYEVLRSKDPCPIQPILTQELDPMVDKVKAYASERMQKAER